MKPSSRLLVEAITGAGRTCLANPLRAALGALAIAVAVGTIAVVVTGLDGFARYARGVSARAFGSDTFVLAQVTTGNTSRKELADKLARNLPVTRSDVRFLERFADQDVIYAPVSQQRADVTAGGRTFENAAVNGTAAALYQIRDIALDSGRFIRRDEETSAAQVAVIGAEIATALFPGREVLGQTVRLAGRGFRVIGVQTRQGSAGGVSLDRYLYIPLPAFERAFGRTDSLQVFARPAERVQVRRAEDRVRVTMRARRQLPAGRPDSFDILTPEAARGFVQRLSERVEAAAAPISIMALLAAIVVVTNTTLVSVTQRTREIGVRRAMGATRRQIAIEVLAESSLVALAGGLVGLFCAQGVLWLASSPLGLDLPVRTSTALWALAAAGASGLAAGWYPARRATRVDIITAIRQE